MYTTPASINKRLVSSSWYNETSVPMWNPNDDTRRALWLCTGKNVLVHETNGTYHDYSWEDSSPAHWAVVSCDSESLNELLTQPYPSNVESSGYLLEIDGLIKLNSISHPCTSPTTAVYGMEIVSPITWISDFVMTYLSWQKSLKEKVQRP